MLSLMTVLCLFKQLWY